MVVTGSTAVEAVRWLEMSIAEEPEGVLEVA